MSRSANRVVAVLIGLGMLLPAIFIGVAVTLHSSVEDLGDTIESLDISFSSSSSSPSGVSAVQGNWPPKLGETYPEMILIDQTGNPFRLSDLKGKTLLIEYAAISCMGCQAFAGGHQRGSYGGFQVQPGLESIDRYARRIAGVDLGSQDVVFVQVLLYGRRNRAPSATDVRGWADHFGMNRDENRIVLGADASMLGPEAYAMIPGFHVVDENFVLRSDSCGHRPRHDLYRELLPTLGRLARQ